MIPTTPGAATTATLEGAPAGLAITARLADNDEILAAVVTVAPKLDGDGDPLDAYTATFAAPAGLPYMLEWLQDATTVVGQELVVLGGAAAAEAYEGYPTREDLVAGSTVDELLASSSAQQDAYRALAILTVENYTGQVFLPFEGEIAVDGSGGRELYLPRRVEALTDVVVQGTSIDLTDVTISDDGARLSFAPLSTSYAVAAMRETSIDSRTFRTGAGTVILSGLFGWSLVPAAVTEAIRCEMEAEALAKTGPLSGVVGQARRLGLQNIAQGNLRAQVGDPSAISPDAARWLTGLVWRGLGGQLV